MSPIAFTATLSTLSNDCLPRRMPADKRANATVLHLSPLAAASPLGRRPNRSSPLDKSWSISL